MISIQVVFPLINAACLAGAGVLVYLSSLIVSQALRVSSKDTIAGDLVLAQLPLAGLIVDAAVKISAYLLSIPAVSHLRLTKRWLDWHLYLTFSSGAITTYLAILILVAELGIYDSLGQIWTPEIDRIQIIVQDRWDCCGWRDDKDESGFAISAACPDGRVAGLKSGCAGGVGGYVDGYLTAVWRTLVVFVVLDVVSIVANICLRKHRDEALERELLRQRHEIGWFNSYQHSVQRHSRASSGIGLMRR